MGLVAVSIKVKLEIVEIADEMVKLGIARSRNHAFNLMIEMGLPKALEIIERKRKVMKLVKEFMEKGLPYKRLPTSDDVEEARKR